MPTTRRQSGGEGRPSSDEASPVKDASAPPKKKAKVTKSTATPRTSNAAHSATASTSKRKQPYALLLHARVVLIDDPIIWRQMLVPPSTNMTKLHCLLQAAFGWANCHLHQFDIKKVDEIGSAKIPTITTPASPEGFTFPDIAIGYRSVHSIKNADRTEDDEDTDDMIYGDMAPEDRPAFSEAARTTVGQLNDKYGLGATEPRAVIFYEYDMGDSWEHVLLVEKVFETEEQVKSTIPEYKGQPLITAGEGHGIAEDAGAEPGWEDLKDAYRVKGTKKDNEDAKDRREWYEKMCSNGDLRGLKGKQRLNHFDKEVANLTYKEFLKFYRMK